VPVERADTDAGTARDRLERHGAVADRERRCCSLQQTLTVAPTNWQR